MDESIVQKYQEAISGIDMRTNLSELRQICKEEDNAKCLKKIVEENPENYAVLLKDEDAKTRKNAALLAGIIRAEELKDLLFQAYLNEDQLYVRPSYLTALKAFDTKEYQPRIEERIQLLTERAVTDTENRKHCAEELRALNELVADTNEDNKHKFTGFKSPYECLLLTNRQFREVTMDQITTGQTTTFSAGVRVKNADIQQLLQIRTYSELLFLIPGVSSVPEQPAEAAELIAQSVLLRFLDNSHKGKAGYCFRVEVKSAMEPDKKGKFIRNFAMQLEMLTKRRLINQPDCYEIEIRLIATREQTFNVLLRLCTFPDTRFSYRKESVAASIRPVNAALLVELAKDFMKPDAQVLDPFCGVGTMLIERQKVVKANTSYGIDSFAEAISKAKVNTQAAGQIIHYINKDFMKFEHSYRFDEVFTNMPFAIGHKTQEDIYDLYYQFFGHVKYLLSDDATLILYTHDKEYIYQLAPQNGFRIVSELDIKLKEGTSLMVLR